MNRIHSDDFCTDPGAQAGVFSTRQLPDPSRRFARGKGAISTVFPGKSSQLFQYALLLADGRHLERAFVLARH
jgi:hypothetical protein